MKKLLMFFIKFIGIICALFILVSAGTYIWLKISSPSLKVFNSYIEKQVNEINPDYQIKIGDIRFAWSLWQLFPHIKITDSSIYTKNLRQIADLPEIFLVLSPVDFINGKIEPVEIKVSSPLIYIASHKSSAPDKDIKITAETGTEDKIQTVLADNLSTHIKNILEQISKLPRNLGKFKILKIIEAVITNNKIKEQNRIQVKKLILKTEFAQIQNLFNLEAEYSFNNRIFHINTLVRQEKESGAVNINISNINPILLAFFFPENKNIPKSKIDLPFQISAQVKIDENDRVLITNINIENNRGKISNPGIWTKPVSIKQFQLSCSLTRNLSCLNIENFFLDLNGPTAKGSGKIKYNPKFPEMNFDIIVKNLNISDAVDLWPRTLEKDVRHWIKDSILKGYINRASLKINLAPDDFNARSIPKNSIKAIVPFRDVTLDYYSPLGMVTQIKGTAKFSADDIDIDVYKALVNNSKITKGKVIVSGMQDKIAKISINADVSGPPDDLRKAVDVLTDNDVIPIHIDKGQAETKLGFNFPLTDFDEKKIKYTASSNIKNMELKDFYKYSIFQKTLFARLVQDDLYVKASNTKVSHEKNLEQPITIKQIEANASILSKPPGMLIKSFFADLDGPVIQTSGHVKIFPDAQDIDLNFDVDKLEAEKAYLYWPTHLAGASRQWIKESLIKGRISGAKVRINIEPGTFTKNMPLKNAFEAYVPFENLELDYYPPLPRLQDAKGKAVFDADSISIDIKKGKAANSIFNNSKAEITGILNNVPYVKIKSSFKGPVDDLIDAEQALFNKYKGPRSKTASAETRFNINFPLKDNIPANEIIYNGTSEIDNINLPGYYGLNLTQGNLSAKINNQKFEASGKIFSGKTKININLDSQIHDTPDADIIEDSGNTVKLSAALNSDNFQDVNIPEIPQIKGTANAELTIRPGSDLTRINSIFDLTNMNLDFEKIGLVKQAGKEAIFHTKADLTQDGKINFSNLHLHGDKIDASGSGRADINSPNPRLQVLLDKLKFGKNDLKLSLKIDNNKYDAEISGKQLDLVPALNSIYNQKQKKAPDSKAYSTVNKSNPVKMNGLISADIEKILLLNEKQLNNVNASIKNIDSGIISADLTGSWDKREKLTLKIAPGKQENILTLKSQHAENILKGLNIFSDIKGGNLEFNAHYKGSIPTSSPVNGKLEIDDFALVGVPLLVKIISMASFIGVAEQLQSRGVAFEKLETDINYHNNILEIEKGMAEGLSLGLTGQGSLDFEQGSINLEGVVIPVNILNKVLDTIPVIGKIITGDGIIATNYTATGSYKNPDVKIKPMSTLAVGGLRRLFNNLKLQNPPDMSNQENSDQEGK